MDVQIDSEERANAKGPASPSSSGSSNLLALRAGAIQGPCGQARTPPEPVSIWAMPKLPWTGLNAKGNPLSSGLHRLDQAARLMWDGNCGSVPIVDGTGRAIAMLTDRDICMAAYTQGKPLHEISVGIAMSKSLQSCALEDTIEHVERLMAEHQIRRIPVLDPAGRPVGMLSLSDLARVAPKQHAEPSPASKCGD